MPHDLAITLNAASAETPESLPIGRAIETLNDAAHAAGTFLVIR